LISIYTYAQGNGLAWFHSIHSRFRSKSLVFPWIQYSLLQLQKVKLTLLALVQLHLFTVTILCSWIKLCGQVSQAAAMEPVIVIIFS